MTNFVHLHVHSEFSVLDGCGKQNAFVAKAVELGFPAVCFTEHGSLRGIHMLHENAKAAGIKPLYGIEFYSARNHKTRGLPQNEIELIQFAHSGKGKQKKEIKKREEELGIKKRYHITVLAKNNVGLKNLYKLSSIAWTDGFYSRPRIDLGLLEQYGEGLIVLSGCLDGYVNQALLNGNEEKALEHVEWFSDRWGEDFYLEIMPNSLAKQKSVNVSLAKIARSLGVELVATADVHYILESDWKAHDVLLCVNTKKKLSDPDRWSFDVKDFWYQTREEMLKGFQKYHSGISEIEIQKALDNTVEIAKKCYADLKVDKFRALIPSPIIPKKYLGNNFLWLLGLCMEGWEQRDIEQHAESLAKKRKADVKLVVVEYEERLQLELKQIKRQMVEGYFLVIWDLYQWVKEQGINRGPGRGSVGGSLVAYLVGIIDVDPVEHGLIFERFMNPGRIDLPDIDCFIKNTPIMTVNGWKNIQDIIPGVDVVATRHGWRVVKACHSRSYFGLVQVFEADSFSFTCTPNHRIIRNRLEEVSANEWGKDDKATVLDVQQNVCAKCMESKILLQRMPIQNSLEIFSNLRMVWKNFFREKNDPKILQSLLRKTTYWFYNKTFVRKSWLSRRFGALRSFSFRSGFRKIVEFSKFKILLRTRAFQNFWWHVSSRFLDSRIGSICGNKRLEKSGCCKSKVGEKGDEKKAIETDSLVSGRSHEIVGKNRYRKFRDWNKKIQRGIDGKESLFVLQKNFQNADVFKSNALFSCLCESKSKRKKIWKGWSTRKDGTKMHHMWADYKTVAKRYKKILQQKMHGKIIQRQEALTKKEKHYEGLVYNLTVDGEGEYNAAGVAVHNCDFEDKRRHEIVDYLIGQYGQDRVARISTVSRMTGKMCFRDLARVLDVPFGEMEQVVDLIVPRSSGDERASNTIEDVIDQTDHGQEFDKKYPDVLKHAKRLEGQTRGLGLHAAGVIVSSDKLTDWIPLETREHNGKRVVCTGVDMVGAEAQGLLKIDVLGLRTLSVIGDCIKLIEDRHDKKIDLNQIELEDKKVLDNFTAHKFAGVFQFDTPLVAKMCKGIVFERFDDIPVMIALGRPGTLRSGLASEYLQRKMNPSERISIHPTIDKICKDTFGVVVFQEQVIKIFTEVAGFSLGVADELRKLIGKRVGEERLRKEKGGFVDGAMANGFPKRLAEEIFDKITFFGEYAFNLAHSTAYGLIGYRQMWLKTYYPLEFMWALLANEPDRQRVIHLIRETKKLGVEVFPVDVNESKEIFSISNDGIRTGLVELKGVGKFAVLSIVQNQPFSSFVDFIERVNLRAVHKGVIEVLAKSGALEKFVPNLKWFLENLEMIWTKRSKQNWSSENLEMIWTKRGKQNWNEWITEELEKSKAEPDYNEDKKEMIATEISPMSFGKNPIQPHLNFLNSLSVDWSLLDNELLEKKWGWIRGFVLETKYKKSEKSGSYVSLNIEDEQGNSKLFKLNSDVLSSAKETVDSGVGTPVVALVTVYKKFKQLRIRALYNVNELYNGNTDTLGKVLVKPDEFFTGCKRNDLARRIKRSKTKTSGVALVVAIDEISDKNGREMAFISLYSKGGMVDVIVFASMWEYARDRMNVGELVDVKVSISRGSNILESVKKFN